jgi:hypothetical protein
MNDRICHNASRGPRNPKGYIKICTVGLPEQLIDELRREAFARGIRLGVYLRQLIEATRIPVVKPE